MEVIKKTVLQAITTGTTTGCTGTCRIIIPDINAIYYFKICLTQENKDFGFYDVPITGETLPIITPIAIVTGTTNNSRLSELKKYKITNIFTEQYISGGTITNDGVDYNNSISGVSVTYYIGGIKYVDNVSTSATTFYVISQGYSSLNFINKPYYKNPTKENIISNPKINDDVFITRQELSAFDMNYRLEYIKSLTDLNTYAGGKFFNIVNNT